MSPTARRTSLVVPILLAGLAGCQDLTSPLDGPMPQFAQVDNGTWTVNTLADPGDGTCDDTECTLREAIAAATTGGTIVFASALQGSILLQSGELEIYAKILDIDGGGRITVDGQQLSGVFHVHADPQSPGTGGLDLTGMTITNGNAFEGGGIFVANGAELTLDNVTVTGSNASTLGGGVNVRLAAATIRNSLISGNTASGGGGIMVSGDLTLIESTVDGNATPGSGGGVLIGVISTVAISGSTISNNDAANRGGGIYNDGTAAIILSTISGNDATTGNGGGIYSDGTLQLQSATLARNHSGQAGGGVSIGNGVMTWANSIIAGNTATVIGNDCSWTAGLAIITSLGHNLSSGCRQQPSASDIFVTSGQAFTQVLDQALQDNGGPTKTHALLARGLAVDAGYCPGETADQRGFTRPVDDPTMPNALDACDIGAYELQGPVVPVADLIVSQSVDKTSVKQGELLTYTVRVQNLGPQTAPNVVLTNTLSSGVTFVEARLTKGTHTAPPKGETGVVTWYIGDMLDQDNEVAEIQVKVLVRGKTTITNTATAAADAVDPNEANNTAAITVTVAQGGGGGGKKK